MTDLKSADLIELGIGLIPMLHVKEEQSEIKPNVVISIV